MQDYPRNIIKEAVEIAVGNLIEEGFDDILGHPMEWWMLREPSLRETVVKEATARLDPGKIEHLKLGPVQRIWSPKKTAHDHRVVTRMSPIDIVTMNALAVLIFERLEARRLPIGQNRVFSYRRAIDGGRLWLRHHDAIRLFNDHVRTRRSDPAIKVVVKCDVYTFYDRVNLHRLQSALAEAGIPQTAHALVNSVLIHLADQNSYGLPVGGNASRVFAEAVMLPIDDFLVEHGVDFCRYVDDFRFFAPDAFTAQRWLLLLVGRLAKDGLALNPSKTHVESASASEEEDEVRRRQEVWLSTPSIPKAETIHSISGRTKVLRRYVTPKAEQRAAYAKVDLAARLSAASDQPVLGADQMQELLKAIEVQQQFARLTEFAKLLRGIPYFIQYFCDFLLRARALIPQTIRAEVSATLGEYLNDPGAAISEWLEARIAETLAHTAYENVPALAARLAGRPVDLGRYGHTALVLALRGKSFSLEKARELRDRANEATGYAERALLVTVDSRLPEGERDAWRRNRKATNPQDLWTRWIVEDFSRAQVHVDEWGNAYSAQWGNGQV